MMFGLGLGGLGIGVMGSASGGGVTPPSTSIAYSVDNSGGSAQTDFQIKVPVAYAAGMQSDFSDVYFADADETTELHHWIESKTNGVSAVFWVKVPSIPVGSKTIYAKYGSGAKSSDGYSTFAMFAGFNLGTQVPRASAYLTTPTYDSSGQAVHPSVVDFGTQWHGYRYWMAMTPYPNTNDQYENPSILASADGTTWVVPSGVTNPLMPTPPADHNNDTHLVYNAGTDELWMYYLDTRRSSSGGDNTNRLVLLKSGDGVAWTNYGNVITWDLSSTELYVCPTIIIKDGTWYMWCIGSTTKQMFRWTSADGVTWTGPTATNLAAGWHFDIKYIASKSEYLAILCSASTLGDMYASRSTDGLNFGIPQLLMTRTVGAWDENIYRPCYIYEPSNDKLRIWYSASQSGTWHIGYTDATGYDSILPDVAQTDLNWTRIAGVTPLANAAAALRGSGGLTVTQTATGSVNCKRALPATDTIVIEWDMYDDMDTTALKALRVASATPQSIGLGVYGGKSTTNYVYHSKTSVYTATSVARTLGWHKFGIEVLNAGTANFYIDGVFVGTLSGQLTTVATVNLAGSQSDTTTYLVDDVRVRKGAAVPPTVAAA